MWAIRKTSEYPEALGRAYLVCYGKGYWEFSARSFAAEWELYTDAQRVLNDLVVNNRDLRNKVTLAWRAS